MKKYSYFIFIFFTGLEPLGFLTMGVIPNSGFDALAAFAAAVIFPWIYYGLSFKNGFLKRQIALIIGVVIFRFVLDAFVTPSLSMGPWRIYLFVGLMYIVYFVFIANINANNFIYVINAFIYITTFVSLISILQILLPGLPIFGGVRPIDEASTVGEGFVRFQTTYYHCSMLAIPLLIYKLIAKGKNTYYFTLIILMLGMHFTTIIIAGYRASMFVLIAVLGLSYLILAKQMMFKYRLFFIILAIPVIIIIYSYTTQRNEQTQSASGEETSLLYRYAELGMGFDKINSEDKWIFGEGYADGFYNPLALAGSEETYYLHNGYASILYNYGVIGAIAWLALILSIIYFIIINFKINNSNPFFVLIALYLLGEMVNNYSSGIFNRERNATFCFLFAFALLEVYVSKISVTKSALET